VKNTVVFFTLCVILIAAMIIGMQRNKGHVSEPVKAQASVENVNIPSIGSIQILNGCGAAGAANKVADFLRKNGFDVKNKGNASTSNYTFTVVVSRKKDMSIARQVARSLSTDKVILMRNNNSDEIYDVTVFIGSDFQERIGQR
jgi:hypothetical protein